MNFKRLNNIVGWLIFAIALAVYLLTMEREFSFWDCGEYIVSSAKLGVTHAPGAAGFQLLGAVWAGLAMGNGAYYALAINSLSAICSAFTILFLFWSITHFARRIIQPQTEVNLDNDQRNAVLLSGVVGALAFTFSDSFWFSAVEGEVYAMASMFTALMLWLACKWENEAGQPRENRWLVLISLLIGLSTGVHLMAILVVPGICYLYYFRHYTFTWKSFAIANLLTGAIFVFVFKIVFAYTMKLFGGLEIFMVNELGLPFHSGSVTSALILIVAFYFGLNYTRKKNYKLANTAILSIMFMLIGFSSWLVIPIRANANPHMNLNDPDDAIGLLDYFNREQYGDWPVFRGPLYTAHIDPDGVLTNPDGSYKMKDNGPIYKKNERKGVYEVVGRKTDYVYNPEHIGWFARMYNQAAINNYQAFFPPETYESFDRQTGEKVTHYKKPTLGQNIQFFLNYQIGYMYLRYLGWNFVGRQNDFEGNLQITKGNTITGIGFIDDFFIGKQEGMPQQFTTDNKAHNVYFAIPLILGLIGFFFQLNRDPGRWFALLSIFLLTGVGIILYTNNRPFEPRERDYALVSSFYVFALWLGLAVLGIYQFVKEKISPKPALLVAAAAMIAPILMGSQNWDDHTRANRKAAHDLAYNYLVNLDKNSILFVYGDNDTYPLWALQETENFRDDVKVVNYTLLGSPWNISQATRKTYNAAGLPSQMKPDDYKLGVNEGILILSENLFGQILQYAQKEEPQLYQAILPLKKYVENGMTAKEAMDWILDRDNPMKKTIVNELKYVYGDMVDNVLPTKKIIVPVDKTAVVANGIVDASQAENIVPNVVFELKSNQIGYKSELMMLDVLANYDWSRSIYFSSGGMYDDVNIFYLNDYLQFEGFSYKFVPIRTPKNEYGEVGTINPNKMYEYINNYHWANFEDKDAYFDPTCTNNILTYRNSVTRTAEALIAKGEKAKAKELIELMSQKVPYQRYIEGISLYSLVPLYHELGETQKADELEAFLKEQEAGEVAYYESLNPVAFSSIASDYKRLIQEQQYAVSSMIEFYLKKKKDTAAALQTFKGFYRPLEEKTKEAVSHAQIVGLVNLSADEQEKLSELFMLQRSMLPFAYDIDSAYAKQKFKEMVDNMDAIDPREQ